MRLKNKLFFIILIFIFFNLASLSFYSCTPKSQPASVRFPYLDPKLPLEKRVNDLLKRMTLEEKIGQLQCYLGEVEGKGIIEAGVGHLAVILRNYGPRESAEKANRLQQLAREKTRLGIPVLIHDEALHGICARGGTSFPQAIGLASTWNPELMLKIARVIGRETRTRGIRHVLSPVVNIARDVRWGRTEETYGEDPYLTSQMGVAFCQGVEAEGVITTPKHFAANVGDGGRDSNPIHFNERLLREIYFPAFKACFEQGGAQAVMAAYNSIDGLPCSAHPWLLTDILRREWNFQGFVVSDYGSVSGILTMHRVAATKKEAAALALKAGLDVELPSVNIYGEPLLQAVKEGLVREEEIDRAVRRVLRAKFKLGLFDHPLVDPEEASRVNDCPEHRQLALEAARQCLVLLKNEDSLLPLKKTLRKILVCGPNADAVRLGGYSGFGQKVVTILEGIKEKVAPSTEVTFVKGCDLEIGPLPAISSDYLVPERDRRGIHGLKAEYFPNMKLEGKPTLVRIDPQINFEWGSGSPAPELPADQFSVRWTGYLVPPKSALYRLGITTDDGVRFYLDGRLLLDFWSDRAPTTDLITVKLEAGRYYEIKIEYYENGGGAVASLGWDLATEEEKALKEVLAASKGAEVAIFVAGILEGEGRDRASLALPGPQDKIIKALADSGLPVVVVLMTGSAVTMEPWFNSVPAILQAWYPGEEGGRAVAEVLFGDYNPGGKLPITFPRHSGQTPLYYNPKPTGRGWDYVDLSGQPLFPFGHGLSYTTFEYRELKIVPEKLTREEEIKIELKIKNTGKMAGDEVVQLYVHDLVASVARPIKELKGFKRVSLNPGEEKTVTFILKAADLAFLDSRLRLVLEPGQLEIMLGSSSADIRLKGSLYIETGKVFGFKK